MKNKKGFTLIELIGVIVILIVILLIAVTTVNKLMEKSRLNAFLEESNQIIKAAENKYASDRTDKTYGVMPDDAFRGTIPGKVCYSIEGSLIGKYVDKTNNKYKGSVEICYGLNCTTPAKIWITNGEKYLTNQPAQETVNNITDETNEEYFYTCGVESIGSGGTSGTTNVAEFDFTESIQRFVVEKNGVYKLEAWGASGGDYNITGANGGTGAYVKAEARLHKGDVLYITVGGQGKMSSNMENCSEENKGYNNAGNYCQYNKSYGAGGGGSTHILSKDGLLKDATLNDIYLVAAGGGGAQGYARPGAGINPNGDTTKYGDGTGRGQAMGGAFNYVGDSYGCSYINNNRIKNPELYFTYSSGNGQYEIKPRLTYEHTAENYSDEPTPEYAKTGNGYAKITYIGDSFSE